MSFSGPGAHQQTKDKQPGTCLLILTGRLVLPERGLSQVLWFGWDRRATPVAFWLRAIHCLDEDLREKFPGPGVRWCSLLVRLPDADDDGA